MNSDMADRMDFTERMKDMDDRDLLEFTAGQVYEICQICPKHSLSIDNHESRITTLETIDTEQNRKLMGIGGVAGGGITAVVGGVIIFVLKHFGISV